MSNGHDDIRHALGAYTAGALDPAERARVDEHLGTCTACREELARFAALPGLLARLSAGEVLPSVLAEDAIATRAIVVAGRERRALRRRLLAWRVATVAAALAVVAVVGVAIVGPTPVDAGDRYVADEASAVAEAVVEPRDWGMRVRLSVDEIPDREGYILWAVPHEGEGEDAYVASWLRSSRPVELVGSCYMAPDLIDRLEVRTVEDEVVAVLTLDRA